LNPVFTRITIHRMMDIIKKVYNRSPNENGKSPTENLIILAMYGYKPVLYQVSINSGKPDKILIAIICKGNKMAKIRLVLFLTFQIKSNKLQQNFVVCELPISL